MDGFPDMSAAKSALAQGSSSDEEGMNPTGSRPTIRLLRRTAA